MKKVKILLVDDHAIIRGALRMALEMDSQLKIIGETNEGLKAVELEKTLRPDLIILDIDMPGMSGLEVAAEIRKTNAEVKIIILTMHEKHQYIYEAMNIGINGYFFKMTNIDKFITAVHSVLNGEDYFDDRITKILMSVSLKNKQGNVAGEDKVYLTEREMDILRLISEGHSSQEIAEKLFISYFTVSNHRKNIMHKLNFKSTAELIKYAVKMTENDR